MSTFEVGSSIEVRAFHAMPDRPGPESELHPHDYRIDVVISRSGLDEGMVCDLDVVDAELERVADSIRDRDLAEIRPGDEPSVTVEVFARWVHASLADAVRAAGGEALSVRVWESPVAFGGYRADIS